MHPINADVYDAMQQGALLTNLGCGSLLRERALVRRMRDSRTVARRLMSIPRSRFPQTPRCGRCRM